MTATSPRLDPRLAEAAFALDARGKPFAETWREVCRLAERLGLPRPGYDTIRLIVRGHRRRAEEIRRLVEPAVANLVRGYPNADDIERVYEATVAWRLDRVARRHVAQP